MPEKEQNKELDDKRDAQEKILGERIRRLEETVSLRKEQIRLLKQIVSKRNYYVSD